MKSFFTKLSVLLFGVAFAVAGCQDYDEDIRKVNDQLNANTAELTSITDALDKAIKDLEAKMVADYATKKALADLSAELKAEIDADVAAAKAALEAAYQEADKALKSGYEAADKALEAKLQKAIADAQDAANKAISGLQTALENAQNQLSNQIQQGLKDANDYTAMLEQYVMGQAEILAGVKTNLEKHIADYKATVEQLQGAIGENTAAIDALRIQLVNSVADAAAALATAKADLEAADTAINARIDAALERITNNEAALQALTTLHKNDVALLQAAIAENSDDITALLLQLNTFKSEYQTTVDLLQGAMAEGDEEVKRQLTNALNAHIEVYEETVDLLQGAMAEGDEAVRQQLTNAINALDELHKTDVANLEAAIAENTTLAQGIKIDLLNHIQTYEATVEQLENQVTTNEAEITALKVRMLALETLHAADMQYMQDINAEMNAALQQETAQRKVADEEFAAAIAAINTEVDKLNNETTELSFVVEYLTAYAEQLQAYVDENAVAIEANAASIELLKAADVVLKGMINDLTADFEAYQKEVDAIYAKKSDVTAVKNWVVEELTKVQNTCLTEIKLVRENLNKVEKSLVEQIKANEGLILALDKAYKQADKEINDKIDQVKEELLTADEAILDSLNNVAAQLNEKIAHVADTLTQNIKNAVDAEKVAREEAVAALEATDKAQGIEIAALKSDLKSLEWTVSYLTGWAMETQASIDDILKRIAALEGNVNDLLARVQKIVYLPDYADHKATINAAQIGDVIIPAPATINYKVYPAELAAEIAGAYSDENPILYFDLKDVKTRTGNTSLEIVSVTGSEGVLSFVVSPRGFADEFFTKRANTSYSVALRLDNGNDDYSTEYTNLVPANEFAQISVAVYNGDLTAANQFVVLDADGETMLADGAEIEYTDRETTCQILPARQLGFQISGDDNIYSEEAIKAMGYDFVVESEVVYGAKNYEGAVETEEGINEIKKAFNTVADETTGTITVSLNDNAKAETVGNALETMYAYEVCGLQAKAGAVVAIVPVEYEFDITLPTITWTYTKDAGPESHGKDYRRSFVLDADDVVATDIPEDYDYIRVIKENGAVEAKVTVNGEPATVKKAVFKTVEIDGVHVPAVEFNGFEWNKTYELEGVCMLPSAKVTFRTTVQTVDRTRSDIRVDLRPIEFQYEKDLVIDYNDADAEVYSLSAVYDILKRGGNFGYMDEEIEAKIKAGYLRDAAVVVNTVDWNNGESRVNDLDGVGFAKNNWASMIYTDADLLAKEQYKVGYTWRTNSLHFKSETVVKEFVYTKTIKTWYGQVITFFQPIKLTNPAAAYNYKPSGIHVSTDVNGLPYSYANGVYTNAAGQIILEGPVAAFRVDAVDMNKAFSVVKGDEIVTDLAAEGLVSEFAFENNTDPQITITDNKINYAGKAPYVDVVGNLYVQNSPDPKTGIASKFEIENTIFDSEPFASYQVRKWDPIKDFTVIDEDATIELPIIESKKYAYTLLKYFSLTDTFAGSELINPDPEVESSWVVGDDTNGFAMGKKAKGIYGLSESFTYTVDTDDQTILNAISVKDGKLGINNEGQLIVLNPVTITVTATINYPQGDRTATINFVIPSRDPSKE